MGRAAWLLLALAACGTARLIHQDQEGGIIQLDGDRTSAMNEAATLMMQQCGAGNFHLISQGEEPVGGTETVPGIGSQRETRPLVAWRIHYVCGLAGSTP
jgi:hypothetical protein|nr:hypothetical protein [Kofleriaceae bacterium]